MRVLVGVGVDTVAVGVRVFVRVGDGTVAVGEPVLVRVGDGTVAVLVGVRVLVGDGTVAVLVGDGTVAVMVGVRDGVRVIVGVRVTVGVNVIVGVFVLVGVRVTVGVNVGVCVGPPLNVRLQLPCVKYKVVPVKSLRYHSEAKFEGTCLNTATNVVDEFGARLENDPVAPGSPAVFAESVGDSRSSEPPPFQN